MNGSKHVFIPIKPNKPMSQWTKEEKKEFKKGKFDKYIRENAPLPFAVTKRVRITQACRLVHMGALLILTTKPFACMRITVKLYRRLLRIT